MKRETVRKTVEAVLTDINLDIHTHVAQRVFDTEEVSKTQRQLGKTALFEALSGKEPTDTAISTKFTKEFPNLCSLLVHSN